MSSSPALVAELMSHFLPRPHHCLKWPRLRSLPAHLMVWTMGTTLAALLFVCGGEIVQEVKANEKHALAFHQGSTSRGHTVADEDHSPRRCNGPEANSPRSCFPTAFLRPPAKGVARSRTRRGRRKMMSWRQHISSTKHCDHRWSSERSLIQQRKSFCRAMQKLYSMRLKGCRLRGLETRSNRNADRRELHLPPPPSKTTSRIWAETLWTTSSRSGFRLEKKREAGPRMPLPWESRRRTYDFRWSSKFSEANATACANNVTDLVSATTDIRAAGVVVEEASNLLLAQMFAVWRMDYIRAVVYLLSGFVASLIVVALPVRLVFFPREYSQAEVESEGGGDVTPEPQQGATAVAAGGDQEDLLSADRPNPPPAKPEKYWLLPWDFARKGTLSSVCQRGDSTEGKIFTTGLVIAEICALLSHYTLIVYDRNCAGFFTILDEELDSIVTERSIDLALRVVWLIVPPVLMIITAAVPSNSFKVHIPNAAPTATAGNAAGPGTSSATRNRVTAIHEDDTRVWSQALHRTVLAAMGLRLIFETRQLFHEPCDISGALFGVSDPLDEQDLRFFVNFADQRVAARCKNEYIRSAWTQAYRGYYLGRVAWLFLGWAFSLLFLALSLACELQDRHAADRSAEDRRHAAAYLEDVRLVPQSASLILPRLSFVAEILAMLTVQALPFWPVLLKVVRHGQGAVWNPPLTPLDVLLRVSLDHWREDASQCGHYFNTDKEKYCTIVHPDREADHAWFSQPAVKLLCRPYDYEIAARTVAQEKLRKHSTYCKTHLR
eukprot:GSA120T00000581001.1